MNRNLFTLGLLVVAFSSSYAQEAIQVYVGDNGKVHIGKAALLYDGGGFATQERGILNVNGDVVIEGSTNSLFKTWEGNNSDKLTGGNVVLRLNEPNAYAAAPEVNGSGTPVFTYGQLAIFDVPQANITGIVDKEYRNIKHGSYQQIGLPFYNKNIVDLRTELGKNFSNTRFSENEILIWNNRNVVFDNLGGITTAKTEEPGAYYILGSKNWSAADQIRTIKGIPYSDLHVDNTKSLASAGAGIIFGTGGNAINAYNERYNSYLQDAFAVTDDGAWAGNYGKNIYQYSNPFLTNLDLKAMALDIPNLRGIRLEVTNVIYTTNVGGGTYDVGGVPGYKFIYPNGVGGVSGDIEFMQIRPLGTFSIKLENDLAQPQIDLSKYRRLAYYAGSQSVANPHSHQNGLHRVRERAKPMSETPGAPAGNTAKELLITGFNADGNPVTQRITYAVSSVYETGATSTENSHQTAAGSRELFGTWEEDLDGGINGDVSSLYWLRVNVANESDYEGKPVFMTSFDPNMTQVKFLLRESGVNNVDLPEGEWMFSSGQGFYYQKDGENPVRITQGDLVNFQGNSSGNSIKLFYGEPKNDGSLATGEAAYAGITRVLFDKTDDNYVVRFDPSWKAASVSVYDMSGRTIQEHAQVDVHSDFRILISGSKQGVYVVKAVSDKGEVVTSKIVIK